MTESVAWTDTTATAAGVFTMQDGRWHMPLRVEMETIEPAAPAGPQPGDTVWLKGHQAGPFLVARRWEDGCWLVRPDGTDPVGKWGGPGGPVWTKVAPECLTTDAPPPAPATDAPPPAPAPEHPPAPTESPWTPRAVCLAAALTCMAFSSAGLALHALGALLR